MLAGDFHHDSESNERRYVLTKVPCTYLSHSAHFSKKKKKKTSVGTDDGNSADRAHTRLLLQCMLTFDRVYDTTNTMANSSSGGEMCAMDGDVSVEMFDYPSPCSSGTPSSSPSTGGCGCRKRGRRLFIRTFIISNRCFRQLTTVATFQRANKTRGSTNKNKIYSTVNKQYTLVRGQHSAGATSRSETW